MILISVIAVILSITGESAMIDKGMADGLRPGDQGTVFYTLKVGQQARRIEVATAEVDAVEDFSARVRLLNRTAAVRKYSIEFQIPEDRTTPDSRLRLARLRLSENRPEIALKYLQRLNGDPALVETVLALKTEAERRIAANREVPRPGPTARPEEAPRVQQPGPAEADEEAAARQKASIEEERKRQGMARISGDTYKIGIDAGAQYFNQRPKFEIRLEEFWIDRQPTYRFGMTHDEAQAHCASLGKRLPTELEWEVAAAANAIVGGPKTEEWTSSWYRPYPGNTVDEPEYGEKFKVVRGFPTIHRRKFIGPDRAAGDITFRCVCK